MTSEYETRLKDRRVFVTGASGFIGRRLVARLCDAGADVGVLTRSSQAARGFAGMPVRVVIGGLENAGVLTSALGGQEILFNLAYDVRAPASANLAGFDTLLAAAISGGVGRIVHTSSIVVYDNWPIRDIDENAAMDRPGGSPYRQAKIEMERRLMAGPLATAVLQPTIVYGPGSTLWTDQLAMALTAGDVVLPRPEGICNGVFVDDVVQAALRAAGLDDLGQERFVISGGEPFAWSALLAGYAAALGQGAIRHEPAEDLLARLGPRSHETDTDRPSAAARVSALARRVLGNQQFENLLRAVKRRLVRAGDFYPDHHLLEEFSGTGICHIDHARKRLGYCPEFDLQKGLAATATHLATLTGRG